MRVVTGDETGLLKLIDLKSKATVSKWGAQSRSRGVVRMAWAPAQGSHSAVATLTTAGNVELWDPLAGALLSTTANVDASSVYLAAFGDRLLSVSKAGRVQAFSPGAKDATGPGCTALDVGPRVAAARLAPGGSGMLAVGGRNHDVQLWDVASGKLAFQAKNVARDWLDREVPVWVSALSFFPTAVRSGIVHGDFSSAISGHAQSKLSDVGVLVSEAQAAGWTDLMDPSAAPAEPAPASASSSSATSGKGKAKGKAAAGAGASAAVAAAAGSAVAEPAGADGPDYLLAACTGYRHVRLYDCRASARPVLNVDMGDAPFTACAATLNGQSLLTGDALGALRRLDMRTLRQTGGYHGAAGSIRDLAVHPGGKPYFAAVGLDRFLRVFHTESREQVRSMYLKQRMTGLLWDVPGAEGSAAAAAAAAEAAAGGASGKSAGKGKAKGKTAGEDKLLTLNEAALDEDFDDEEDDGHDDDDGEDDEDELVAEDPGRPARIQITNFPKAARMFELQPASDDEDEDDEGEDDEDEDDGDDGEDGENGMAEDDERDDDEDDDEAAAAVASSSGNSAAAAGRSKSALSSAGKGKASAGAAQDDDDEEDDEEDDDVADDDSLLDFDGDDDDDEDDEDGEDDDASGSDSGGEGKSKGKGRKDAGGRGKPAAARGGAGGAAKRARKGGRGDGSSDDEGESGAAADRVSMLLGEGRAAAEAKKALKLERKRMEKLPGKAGRDAKAKNAKKR